MKKQKINKFVIDIHDPHKMARVKLNGEIIFLGNFWDYHPGCHGAVWEVNGKDIDLGSNWSSYRGFVNALGTKMKQLGMGDYTLEYKERKRPIPC